MGLGGVELVMAVEQEFHIDIPDRDAERLETVGQLFDYVLERLGRPRTAGCSHRVVDALVGDEVH